ncbi:MAG: U32 family peptidase [Bulleidia sp.]
MKKIELLAPAGNMESLKAAVAGGCDAVYMGLTVFSARAFAGNFTHEQFQEAIAYCHPRNVRIYVTMNTMLYETEMENAKKEVQFLYNHDVDGILVQDMGLFHYIRTCYPDLDVHCSTQMHIHNINGVKKMKQEGAARVVLARETPIELIRKAVQTGVEIEVFVYGAICISYSGQCLFSAAMKHRSANRGMCAQCCRLKYYDEDGKPFREGEYILSPRDLNVIDEIPQLIDAGVSSLKIEGRMKRPEYVYLVTKTFREAIDACYAGKPYTVSGLREKHLKEMFNRDFSKGHLFHDDVEHRMSSYRPNHRGITVGKVVSCHRGRVTVHLSEGICQHDGLRILSTPMDIGINAARIEKNGRLVNHADAGDTVVLTCPMDQKARKGDFLQKTTDTVLIEQINAEIRERVRTIPVTMDVYAHVDEPLKIIVTDERNNIVEVCSDVVCQKAQKAPLSTERIESAMTKTGDLPFEIIIRSMDCDEIFLPVSVLNDTRRNALESLYAKRRTLHERKGMKPYSVTLNVTEKPAFRMIVQSDSDIDGVQYNAWIVRKKQILPVIHEDFDEQLILSDCIVSSTGDFSCQLKQGVIAGMTCNIANSYALAWCYMQGVQGVIVSSEISDDQLENMIAGFAARYGFEPAVYLPVYGQRTLMYIKDRFRRNPETITDLHGNVYPVHVEKGVTMIEEPECYTRHNPCAYGSYVILNENVEHIQDILEECYEEISGRIQGIYQ